ncbi:MAG: chorismate mutase [Candidatus Margulisbacteria bacterium]|nr:chorismate mutase [Candidatus Margulisiibacteriota bacterium]
MVLRGVRGATTVKHNTREEILSAAKELLTAMVKANQINIADIASIIFTVTPDLDAVFPAEAAREIGWNDTPLLCAIEIPVPSALPNCIRLLMHINTDKNQNEIKHIYLHAAVNLRR